MATTFNSSILSNIYKDDFSDSDNYHRILFNSGRPLQARELTQMQTIIQEQIKRFGSNVFKEGGVVKPGERILNTGYEFVKLNTLSLGLPTDTSTIVGTTFTGNTSGVTARIIEVVAATGSEPATIYVAYTNAPSARSGVTTVRFAPDETMTNGAVSLKVQLTDTDLNPAVGTGTRLSIGTGVYYAKGFFVFTEAQSVIVSKYTNDPTEIVGYKIEEKVFTVDDDTGLYDNQGAVPNVSSPGADRLKIDLTLFVQNNITADDNFIPILSIVDGAVHRVVDLSNSYEVVRDFVATRIHENSGDYLVKAYKLFFDKDSEQSHIIANISDGTAVVDGYRAHNFMPTAIRIPKPVTTAEIENEVTAVAFGQYVLVDASVIGNTQGIPNINNFDELEIRNNATWGSGSKIGTCRVRQVVRDANTIFYRYYVFDIKMIGTNNFRDAAIIGTGATDNFKPYRPLGKTRLQDVGKNSLLFEIPNSRPRAFDDIVLTVQRRISVNSGAGGTSTVPALTATGETFANSNDWIIAKNDSDILQGINFVSGTPNGTQSASLTNLPANQSNMDLIVYVNKANATPRTKQLKETTITINDSAGEIPLGYADIYDVTRVREADSDGANLITTYGFDNGQRDNYYGRGKLIRKTGLSAPNKPVFVRFKYFEHGTAGDFFCINSYTGEVDYDKIPSYRTSAGKLVQLRNVIDLRSVVDSDNQFADVTKGARVHELPQVNDTISADITYYLPRKDTLTVDVDGFLSFDRGVPSFNPTKPDRKIGTLPLYDVFLSGNTLNNRDLKVEKYDHKRFTMRDIGQLEDRVEKLEEVTALSLLEAETKNLEVLDSAGNNRTKSGFFVDNFSTQIFSDIRNKDYRASIDPQMKFVRPLHHETNIRMIYDSAQSSHVVHKGDNLYLPFTSITYFDQDTASKSIRVNPFEATVYHGDIDLSPSSDEWREVNVAATKAVNGGSKLNTSQAVLWNNWEWNWGGTKISDLKIGSNQSNVVDTTASKTTYVNTVVKEETVKEVIGERVLSVSLIPYMRSKRVFFKAQGLRPSSRVFVYFNGVKMDSWVKQETFQYSSNFDVDYGNTQDKATQHPEGATAILTTDSFGKIEGSLFIPNTRAQVFRTGVAEFKILDVSENNERFSGTVAKARYSATGYIDHIEQTIKSTRVLHVEGSTSVEKKYYNSGGGGGGGDDHFGGGSDHWNGMYQGTWDGDHHNAFDGGGGWDDGPDDDGGYGGEPDDDWCLTEDMKVLLNGAIDFVTNVNVGDMVGNSIVMKVLHKHMREGYYVINNELKITNDHPVFANGSWKRTDNLVLGDYINDVKVASIEYIEQITPTVYIGIADDSYDVYTEGEIYTVHGRYKEAAAVTHKTTNAA